MNLKKLENARAKQLRREAQWAEDIRSGGDPWAPFSDALEQATAKYGMTFKDRDRLYNSMAYVIAHERADAFDNLVIGFRRPESDGLEQERRLVA